MNIESPYYKLYSKAKLLKYSSKLLTSVIFRAEKGFASDSEISEAVEDNEKVISILKDYLKEITEPKIVVRTKEVISSITVNEKTFFPNLSFRKFEKSDWLGYSGAEDFKTGEEPFISEIEGISLYPDKNVFTVDIIGDKSGIEVFLYEEDYTQDEEDLLEETYFLSLDSSYSTILLTAFLIPKDFEISELEELGFKKV